MAFGDSLGGPFYFVSSELTMMSRYLNEMHSHLERDLKQLEEQGKALQDKFDSTTEEDFEYPHERDLYAEYLFEPYRERYSVIGRDYPRRLFSSFLVSLYSFIEDELNDICSRLRIKKGEYCAEGERCEAVKGRSLELPACQIKEKLRVNIKDTRQWAEIIIFRSIRNDIVHKNGLIPYKQAASPEDEPHQINVKDHIRQYLDRYRLIEVEAFGGQITPNFDYCQHLIEITREFLHTIYMATGIQKKPYVRPVEPDGL